MALLFAIVYCYKEGLNPYQISKPFRDVWKKDETEQKSLKSFVIFPAEVDYRSHIFNSNKKALEFCANYKITWNIIQITDSFVNQLGKTSWENFSSNPQDICRSAIMRFEIKQVFKLKTNEQNKTALKKKINYSLQNFRLFLI